MADSLQFLAHLNTNVMRDPPTENRHSVGRQIAAHRTENDSIHHEYHQPGEIYKKNNVFTYDSASVGFLATAKVFADSVDITSEVSSYIDLGTGTGMTALFCIRNLLPKQNTFGILLVDGVLGLLQQAATKIEAEFAPDTFLWRRLSNANVFGEMGIIRQALVAEHKLPTVDLITAQRLLLNLKKSSHIEQLQQWAKFLNRQGKLVVDISHPARRVGSITVQTTPFETTLVTADDYTWEECRETAREYALNAGLIIVNDLPPQLPPRGLLNMGNQLESWISASKAETVLLPLSRDEEHFYGNRYTAHLRESLTTRNFMSTVAIASVIAVFQLPPSAQQSYTKYTIDESLTGQERRKAIKQAAKKAKKAPGQGSPENDNDSGAGSSEAVA